MAAPEFSEYKKDRKGRAVSPPATGNRGKREGTDPFPMKPGFKTGLPGKKQSRDRSGGVYRCSVYPDSEGL